jgi:hypothetical protein
LFGNKKKFKVAGEKPGVAHNNKRKHSECPADVTERLKHSTKQKALQMSAGLL